MQPLELSLHLCLCKLGLIKSIADLSTFKRHISEAVEARFKQSSTKDSLKVAIDGIIGKSKGSGSLTEEELMSDSITLFTIAMHVTTNCMLTAVEYFLFFCCWAKNVLQPHQVLNVFFSHNY